MPTLSQIEANRRARLRALQTLKQLQAEAEATPAPAPVVEPEDSPSLSHSPQTTSPQIGFVPSTPAAAPPQAAPRDPSPGPSGPEPVGTRCPQIRQTGEHLHGSPTTMSRT